MKITRHKMCASARAGGSERVADSSFVRRHLPPASMRYLNFSLFLSHCVHAVQFLFAINAAS